MMIVGATAHRWRLFEIGVSHAKVIRSKFKAVTVEIREGGIQF